MTTQLDRARSVFSSRLDVLEGILEKARREWRDAGRDPESLLALRLASDMHPLAFQIVFTAEQPRQWTAFCSKREPGDFVAPASLTLDGALDLLREVRDGMQAVDAKDEVLSRERHLSLMGGITLQLSGEDYLHEFLMPNFYFHLVTAYDILRHAGVKLGKADYMAYLASHVRRPG